jgi:hypothetical protein
MSDPYYQGDAHNDAKLQIEYGRDGINRRKIDTQKRVQAGNPFQAGPKGEGTGGRDRRIKIDKAVDDAS